jgi:fatty-acyl-CoA synthase
VLAVDETGAFPTRFSTPDRPSTVRRAARSPTSVQIDLSAADQEFTFTMFSLTDYEWLSTSQIVSLRGRSYAHGPSDLPLLGETIGEHLRTTVERFGEREALVVPHQGYRATYEELWEQVEAAARAFIAHGVDKGDRVAIWAPNRYEWVVTQFAAARIGAVLVAIDPTYTPAELAYTLNKAGVSVLVMARAFRTADYAGMLDDVRPSCHSLRETIVLEQDWEAFLADAEYTSGGELAEREASLQFDDAITIQFTAGTTGLPKGATLSHHNILNNAYFTALQLGYGEEDRVCVPVPFSHWFGNVVGALASATQGACVVVPGESFGARAVLEAVQAERCTSLYGVPSMFIAELEQPDLGRFDLSSLRTGVMSGAPCPVEVMKRVRTHMHLGDLMVVSGMTESSPVSAQTALDEPLERQVATVGRVHPHLEIKIVDPVTGKIVPRGTPGEQCVRGYSVMLGYWEDEQSTTIAIDGAGWLHTGDLASMDDEGYISIVGRIQDVIVRGAEKVHPREVEEFLYRLPEVSDAEVIGVPSAHYGEAVMAWVKLREGASLSEQALVAACRGQIASYKIPRYWKIVDSFPMTVTGKVQKHRMRELAIQELGL